MSSKSWSLDLSGEHSALSFRSFVTDIVPFCTKFANAVWLKISFSNGWITRLQFLSVLWGCFSGLISLLEGTEAPLIFCFWGLIRLLEETETPLIFCFWGLIRLLEGVEAALFSGLFEICFLGLIRLLEAAPLFGLFEIRASDLRGLFCGGVDFGLSVFSGFFRGLVLFTNGDSEVLALVFSGEIILDVLGIWTCFRVTRFSDLLI